MAGNYNICSENILVIDVLDQISLAARICQSEQSPFFLKVQIRLLRFLQQPIYFDHSLMFKLIVLSITV
jgi:hypothetical protein